MTQTEDRPRPGRLSDALRSAVPVARHLALPLGLVIAALVIANPFDIGVPPTPGEVYVSWDKNIGRLGILPVYPPEENFYVGDVLATVTSAADQTAVGRAIRVGHIDLSDTYLVNVAPKAVAVPGVIANPAAESILTPYGEVETTIVAFPGVIASTTTTRSSSWLWSQIGLHVDRDLNDTEEISIPLAQSYSADASQALARLLDWCDAKATAARCKDDFLHRLMALSLGGDDATLSTGIELVTQVYLTRKIDHRSVVGGGRLVDLSTSKAAAETKTETIAPDASSKSAQSMTTSLEQEFPRPVVFGYRGVGFAVEREDNAKGH